MSLTDTFTYTWKFLKVEIIKFCAGYVVLGLSRSNYLYLTPTHLSQVICMYIFLFETQILFLFHNLSLKIYVLKFLSKFSKGKKVSCKMFFLFGPSFPYVKESTKFIFPRNVHGSISQNSLFRIESDLYGTYYFKYSSSVKKGTVPQSSTFGKC